MDGLVLKYAHQLRSLMTQLENSSHNEFDAHREELWSWKIYGEWQQERYDSHSRQQLKQSNKN